MAIGTAVERNGWVYVYDDAAVSKALFLANKTTVLK